MKDYVYTGTELELFSQAKNWKNYVRAVLKKYVQGDVLEVGAGIGTNTQLFSSLPYQSWTCLEPDSSLVEALEHSILVNKIPHCQVQHGTIECLENDQLFDLILYIDVLEHIEDDTTELAKSAQHLKPGGIIAILSPAHQWLFTPFDASIGHYRRYSKRTIRCAVPNDVQIAKVLYLDCVGLLASLANKLLLKQNCPTLKQIKMWDNLMVPLSKVLDPVFQNLIGKSIVLIGVRKNHF